MTDYTNATSMPWYSHFSEIKTIIISGITHIGNWAFRSCTTAMSVTIGDSVTTIGDFCFQDCFSFTSITISDSVTTIGSSCFNGCKGVTSITFKGNKPTLGPNSFSLGTSTVLVTATVYFSGWANATVFTSTIIGSYTTLSYVTV